MNVTLVSSLPPDKGITPYTLQLIEALSAHPDIQVDAVGFRSMYPRFMYPGGHPENESLVETNTTLGRRIMSWWDPTSWLRAGFRANGDIVHAQWWSWFLAPSYMTLLATAKRRGHPIVMTVHNAQPHELAGWKRRLNSAVVRMADHLIVHSERNRETLIADGFDPKSISVIPLGVHAVPTEDQGRVAARMSLGIPLEARVVLLPGNIRTYKGTRVFAEAIARMRERVPGLYAMIAGELWKGAPDPRLEVAAAGVEDLFDLRLGFVPDDKFKALFEAADVVVLPYTHFDAQSAAATHALTAQRALVVSDVGGLPELVRDARAIVPAGNPAALADSLSAILNDATLLAKLERDTTQVRAAMSWEGVTERTYDVYRHVLDIDRKQARAKAA